jgi:hypothetical protein
MKSRTRRADLPNKVTIRRTDLSSEVPSPRAEPNLKLESVWVRVSALGVKVEASSSTTAHSPMSIAASVFLATITILGLSSGLGALVRWLGGPVWMCLAAAALGLVISTALSIALLSRAVRHNKEEQ